MILKPKTCAALALVLLLTQTAASAHAARVCPPATNETVTDGTVLSYGQMSAPPDPISSAFFVAITIGNVADLTPPVDAIPGTTVSYIRSGTTLAAALGSCSVLPSPVLCGMKQYATTQFVDAGGAPLQNGDFSIAPGAVVHVHACTPAVDGWPYAMYFQVIKPVAVPHD